MYARSHCVALGHNLVGLRFLVCIGVSYCASGDMLGSILVGGAWWCASQVFWCVIWLWFLAVHGVSFYPGLCFELFI